MSRPTITDENGDEHFGYGELLKPDTVDALIAQHNEHAAALDTLEAADLPITVEMDGEDTFVQIDEDTVVNGVLSADNLTGGGLLIAGNAGVLVKNGSNATWFDIDAAGGDVGIYGDNLAFILKTDAGIDGIGFYGTPPIAKQTGVAVSTAAIHAALVALGLIAA